MTVCFHLSYSLALPWIVESGCLKPFPHTIGDGPIRSFLWATTNLDGDNTARAAIIAAAQDQAFREGRFELIRFTLPAARFRRWRDVAPMYGWTAAALALRAEADRRAHGCEDGYQEGWRCRRTPFPLSDVLKVEARSYAGRWRPIALDPGRVVNTLNPDKKGYRFGRRTLFSIRLRGLKFRGVQTYGYRPELTEDEEAEEAYAARRMAEASEYEQPWDDAP